MGDRILPGVVPSTVFTHRLVTPKVVYAGMRVCCCITLFAPCNARMEVSTDIISMHG